MSKEISASGEQDGERLPSVDIQLYKKLAELETLYTGRVREDLHRALETHLNSTRDGIVDDIVERIKTTFLDQLEEFKRIESELFQMLEISLTKEYRTILEDWKKRNTELFFFLRLIRQQAIDSSERVSRFETREKVVDSALALSAAAFPFVYSIASPYFAEGAVLEVLAPTIYLMAIFTLAGFKITYSRRREREESRLKEFVESNFQKASVYASHVNDKNHGGDEAGRRQ